jgi:hypothetical protein
MEVKLKAQSLTLKAEGTKLKVESLRQNVTAQ